MTTTEHLVAALDTTGVLPVAWRDAFLAVPRHAFLPTKIWMDDGESEPQPIDRDIDPDRWLESAYANVAIVTQFDDGATVWPAIGTHRTSSASEPAMVAAMLDCLDVREGQRVLDIGTGTGYTRGPARPPARRVPGDDGGDRPGDRRSGENRAGSRTPYADLSSVDFDDRHGDAEVSQTTTQPWLVARTVDVRWAISTRIKPCRWGHRPPTANRAAHQLWFADNVTGSWAVARYDRTGGPYRIRQHGPRRLWNEIETAYHWWSDQGKPPLNHWRLTISNDQQTATLTN